MEKINKYTKFVITAKEYIKRYEDYMSYYNTYFKAKNDILKYNDKIKEYMIWGIDLYRNEIKQCKYEIKQCQKLIKTFKFKDIREFNYDKTLELLLTFYDNFNYDEYVKRIKTFCCNDNILLLHSLYLLLINIGMKEPKWYLGIINFYICENDISDYFSNNDKIMYEYCNEILASIKFKNIEHFKSLVDKINDETFWMLFYYYFNDNIKNMLIFHNVDVVKYLNILNCKNHCDNFIDIIDSKYKFSNFDLSVLDIK